MRVAARQHWVAQCGRQDGGVSPALPALRAAFSVPLHSLQVYFTCSLPLKQDTDVQQQCLVIRVLGSGATALLYGCLLKF
jgi:hypothetical protein